MDIDAMLAIEALLVDEHALLVVLTGEKTFRKRRAFIRKRLVRRNDCKLRRFKTAFHSFFRGISGYHSATEDDRLVRVHVLRIHPRFSISHMKQSVPSGSRYQ